MAAKFEIIFLYSGYDKKDLRYLKMVDIMYAFYGCLYDQVCQEKLSNPDSVGFKSVSFTRYLRALR